MTYPMRISPCTSTIETAVYVNRTHGGVRGRELVTPSYSIILYILEYTAMRLEYTISKSTLKFTNSIFKYFEPDENANVRS